MYITYWLVRIVQTLLKFIRYITLNILTFENIYKKIKIIR